MSKLTSELDTLEGSLE